MSKRESFARYMLIINKLRSFSASFDEMSNFLAEESEISGYNYNISLRTFQRDLNDIRSLFHIDIQNKNGRYKIIEDNSELSKRILEAFDTFNTLNLVEKIPTHIYFESRRPMGTENMRSLLQAIDLKKKITFTYHKFWQNEITERKVEPYALKEFKNRWYLLSKDLGDNRIKTFALDRLFNLKITKQEFLQDKGFDVENYFKHNFGIITPNDGRPEEIILSFEPFQGKYVKNLLIHSSQEVLIDSEDELRIKLNIVITFDFIMELLSHGEKVKVIQPESLKKKMKKRLEKALLHYV